MIVFVAISRIGIGINNPFVAKAAISEIPADKLPSAMSTMNFFRILGTALGTTIWVVFLELRTHFHSSNLINTQTPSNHTSTETINKLMSLLSKGGIYDVNLMPFAVEFLGRSIYSKAVNFGYQDGFYMLIFIFLFAALFGLLLGRR